MPGNSSSLVDVQSVAAVVEERLRHAGSFIVAAPDRAHQLRSQVASVIAEVTAEVLEQSATFSPALSNHIGTSRAANRVPPTESLYAAQVLFEAALPALIQALPAQPEQTADQRAREIALCLHRAIMKRVAHGAVSYVDFLLEHLHTSHQEERQRIARDLHDRAAHGVAVALQGLELYEVYARTDPSRAAERLQATREALYESIGTIKAVANDLRDTLSGRGLTNALSWYAERFVPADAHCSIEVVGDPETLPQHIAEELYLVLREAIRNATLHADPSVVDVVVEVSDTAVTARVMDNGSGFEPSRASGIGLNSMRERLELLGGSLTVTSVSGQGADVAIVVPLTARPR